MRNRILYLARLPVTCFFLAVLLLQPGISAEVKREFGTISSNGDSTTPMVSDDGRYLTFASAAANLSTNDGNGTLDIFLHDRRTKHTDLISVATNGMSGNGLSYHPVISSNGLRIVFQSRASDLVRGDTNGWDDIFVRNTISGTTDLVSVNRDGTASGDGMSFNPMMTPDGRFVVFESFANNLALNQNDRHGLTDIFVRDLTTRATTLISINASGTSTAFSGAMNPSITPDGRFIVFESWSSDLVTNDFNRELDAFIYDVPGKTNRLINIIRPGGGYDPGSVKPAVADSGEFVVFATVNGTFIRDLTTHSVTNLTSIGGHSVISRDGQVIVCETLLDLSIRSVTSRAPRTNSLYAWDARTRTNRLLTVSHTGTSAAVGHSHSPIISADSRYVTFISNATNLVDNATNGQFQVYQHDLESGVTTLVSVNRQGNGNNRDCFGATATADGNTVAFASAATDLVANDTNRAYDIYLVKLRERDSDHDGMDDDWEATYFGDLARDGAGDSDGDGASDLAEYRAGTDPTGRASVFRVVKVESLLTGDVTVFWQAVPGRIYQVQFKDRLSDPAWTDFAETVTTGEARASQSDPGANASPSRFYRVKLVVP